MMMSEKKKRFVEDHSYLINYDKYCILDKMQHKHLYLDEVIGLLNEQQTTINNQEQKIRILQQEIADTQAILEMLTEKLKGWK